LPRDVLTILAVVKQALAVGRENRERQRVVIEMAVFDLLFVRTGAVSVCSSSKFMALSRRANSSCWVSKSLSSFSVVCCQAKSRRCPRPRWSAGKTGASGGRAG
jgi:hypothetical protein